MAMHYSKICLGIIFLLFLQTIMQGQVKSKKSYGVNFNAGANIVSFSTSSISTKGVEAELEVYINNSKIDYSSLDKKKNNAVLQNGRLKQAYGITFALKGYKKVEENIILQAGAGVFGEIAPLTKYKFSSTQNGIINSIDSTKPTMFQFGLFFPLGVQYLINNHIAIGVSNVVTFGFLRNGYKAPANTISDQTTYFNFGFANPTISLKIYFNKK